MLTKITTNFSARYTKFCFHSFKRLSIKFLDVTRMIRITLELRGKVCNQVSGSLERAKTEMTCNKEREHGMMK